MEAVIFVGIQGSGKSTFFRDRFFDTHVRINLDMLRTRPREKIFLEASLEAKQKFVLDNTNLTREEREIRQKLTVSKLSDIIFKRIWKKPSSKIIGAEAKRKFPKKVYSTHLKDCKFRSLTKVLTNCFTFQ